MFKRWKKTAAVLNKGLERESFINVKLREELKELRSVLREHDEHIVMMEDKLREIIRERENDNK